MCKCCLWDILEGKQEMSKVTLCLIEPITLNFEPLENEKSFPFQRNISPTLFSILYHLYGKQPCHEEKMT